MSSFSNNVRSSSQEFSSSFFQQNLPPILNTRADLLPRFNLITVWTKFPKCPVIYLVIKIVRSSIARVSACRDSTLVLPGLSYRAKRHSRIFISPERFIFLTKISAWIQSSKSKIQNGTFGTITRSFTSNDNMVSRICITPQNFLWTLPIIGNEQEIHYIAIAFYQNLLHIVQFWATQVRASTNNKSSTERTAKNIGKSKICRKKIRYPPKHYIEPQRNITFVRI